MSVGNIPDEIIAAVLKHHDIVEIIGHYVHLSKQGRNYKGLCPFHSEKTPSFTVSPDKQIFTCFGCGKSGNTIKFMMEVEGYTFPEAVRHLAEEANIPADWVSSPGEEETAQQKDRRSIIEANELSAQWYHFLLKNANIGKEAMDYLRKRGFNDKIIDAFQIGYAPPMRDKLAEFLKSRKFDLELMEKGGLVNFRTDGSGCSDRFRDRIMFPIRNARGQVIAFAGRAVQSDLQPKYLNSPETALFNKSRVLYNLDQAKPHIRKSQTVVLFEGYADTIKAWETGVLNGVASMGTSLTADHARLIKRFAEKVVICYDGDNAGQSAAFKGLPILEEAGCSAAVAMLPGNLDPDEYIARFGADKFVREIIEGAVPSTKFKLIYLQRNHILQEDDGKLKYIDDALKIIAKLRTPTEREHYIKELSSEFHYSISSLTEQMHQIRMEAQKLQQYRDNKENTWNNVMNDGKGTNISNPLFPAYQNAERKLISIMMEDRDVALFVQEQLGDQFNIEAHAALAAYLYAYYAKHDDSDPSRFIASLNNDQLESLAAALSMTEPVHGVNARVVEDYIKEIKKYPQLQELERKKETMMQAERSGDILGAARIASEIISLERQFKSI